MRESRHLGNGVERSAAFQARSQPDGSVVCVGDELQERTARWIGGAGFQSSCWQIMGYHTGDSLNLEE